MENCGHCGSHPQLPFKCSYCGGIYCETDRLPEGHECDGVRFLSDPGKRFENKATDEIVGESEDIRTPQPITPEYTAGSTPDPEYESSPPVQVKDEREHKKGDEHFGIWDRLRGLFS